MSLIKEALRENFISYSRCIKVGCPMADICNVDDVSQSYPKGLRLAEEGKVKFNGLGAEHTFECFEGNTEDGEPCGYAITKPTSQPELL